MVMLIWPLFHQAWTRMMTCRKMYLNWRQEFLTLQKCSLPVKTYLGGIRIVEYPLHLIV